MAKIASLLLAIALWYLIDQHLRKGGAFEMLPSDRESRTPTGETVPPRDDF